jgi:uncharacterized protein (TIGR04255 family)
MPDQYPTLSKAPITEALVDIRCKLPKGFSLDQFKTIGAKISGDYPFERVMRLHETKIRIDVKDDEQSVTTLGKMNGYRYESSNRTRIVQLRLDGFTFNRLKPYSTWIEVRDEALRLWNLYTELVKPVFINRIALRYINNLNVPMPVRNFRDYLTCPPEAPEGPTTGISSFFNRVVVATEDSRLNAIITQALEPKVDVENYLPIILDIDVIKFTMDGFLEEDILAILEKLRDFKNQIFFNSITKKLLEEYL